VITKQPAVGGDEVTVTFSVPASERRISVAGDFNGWDVNATPLQPNGGTASASVPLNLGRRYAFRYVDETGYWFNDDDADDFELNPLGGTNCIVDLTSPGITDTSDDRLDEAPADANTGAAAGWLWPLERAVAVATAPVARVTRMLRRCF
jgi:1,4-alpha-glucan branching enzyme